MKSKINNNNSSNKRNENMNSNPKNIEFVEDLAKNCYINYFDNIFCVFNSINNILYLIYLIKNQDETNSIISYNINEYKIINIIKNAHSGYITNLRHYLDMINKRDLILSISSKNNNIKIWNINNFECILDLKNINKKGLLFSSCFFNDNNKLYLITSNYSFNDSEPIKLYNLEGKKIKEINSSNDSTVFIDSYYDNKISKYFIVTGNKGDVKSYDYEENKLYFKYSHDDISNHNSIIIVNNENLIKLIESSSHGRIRIWNFHKGQLIRTIMVYRIGSIYGLYLWNNEYFFAACSDKKIRLININRARIFNDFTGHSSDVLTIKKLNHPKYGECLVSYSGEIKLWLVKK